MFWRKARRNSFDPDVLLDRDDQGPSADFMESLKERVGIVIVIVIVVIIVIYNNKSWTWVTTLQTLSVSRVSQHNTWKKLNKILKLGVPSMLRIWKISIALSFFLYGGVDDDWWTTWLENTLLTGAVYLQALKTFYDQGLVRRRESWREPVTCLVSHFVSLSSVQHCNVNHFYNMLFMNYVIRRGVGGA